MRSPELSSLRDRSVGRRGGRALVATGLAAALLAAMPGRAGAATTLRSAPMFASDGDSLICSVVNWDTRPRSIAVRIVLVAGGGGDVATATCTPTVPLASCIAIESVLVPIVSSGVFACEVQADGPTSRLRAVLENVTTGRSVEVR